MSNTHHDMPDDRDPELPIMETMIPSVPVGPTEREHHMTDTLYGKSPEHPSYADLQREIVKLKGECAEWAGLSGVDAGRIALLKQELKELAAKRADLEGQAKAWTLIWRKCQELGILSFVSPFGPAMERVVAFIQHLKDERDKFKTELASLREAERWKDFKPGDMK